MDIHRDECAFVKVDVQAGESGEGGEDVLETNELGQLALKDDQGVIGVLKGGTRQGRG